MVEVGTTNRTRIDDYRRAITEETRAFVRVHTSNYRIHGFVASVSIEELVRLASNDPVASAWASIPDAPGGHPKGGWTG